MKLAKDILKNVKIVRQTGRTDIPVHNLCIDSRDCSANSLYVAVVGTQVDGHKYVAQAIANGANAIVHQNELSDKQKGILYLQVDNTRAVLGVLAADFYDNPTRNLKLVGITGTNGKTTVATLLHDLFTNLGYKVGLFSTVEIRIHSQRVKTMHTTPDPITLNRYFAEMVHAGCQFAFMEVSSHAIHQQRITGLHFVGGAFTNITHDHLDYHQTFSAYIKAKKLFFDQLPAQAFVVINVDDRNARVMVQNTNAQVKTLALDRMADYKARILEHDFHGMALLLQNTDFWTPFIGKFNAYNLLTVYAIAMELGEEEQQVLETLSVLKSVVGRFDTIRFGENITAIVDYAHTPDALENLLTTVKDINVAQKQIIVVVGAGGNRDKTKRPTMAKIAAEYASRLILTSDNPRDEQPNAIIEDMAQGLPVGKLMQTLKIADRKEAIKTAIMLAAKGDIIVVAGKGHETYQEINGVRHHFDDKEIIVELTSSIYN